MRFLEHHQKNEIPCEYYFFLFITNENNCNNILNSLYTFLEFLVKVNDKENDKDNTNEKKLIEPYKYKLDLNNTDSIIKCKNLIHQLINYSTQSKENLYNITQFYYQNWIDLIYYPQDLP